MLVLQLVALLCGIAARVQHYRSLFVIYFFPIHISTNKLLLVLQQEPSHIRVCKPTTAENYVHFLGHFSEKVERNGIFLLQWGEQLKYISKGELVVEKQP